MASRTILRSLRWCNDPDDDVNPPGSAVCRQRRSRAHLRSRLAAAAAAGEAADTSQPQQQQQQQAVEIRIPVHAVVLAGYSEYFKALICSWSGNLNRMLTLDVGVGEGHAAELMIEFM